MQLVEFLSVRMHIVVLQAELDQLPPEVPTYLTAAVGPSKIASARKWCSVCGNISP